MQLERPVSGLEADPVDPLAFLLAFVDLIVLHDMFVSLLVRMILQVLDFPIAAAFQEDYDIR